MKQLTIGALAAVLALGVLACEPATKQDMEALKQQQAEILKKLAALEEGQKKLVPAARPGPPAEDYNKVHKIDVGSSPILGNANAPITLVEYSDFQCPYCARSAPDMKALQAKYPGKVRVVYKHFPLGFHKSARPTAIASVAAQEQGKFWEYHDVLFEATDKRQLAHSDEDLAKYAEQAGLDVAKFKADMAANKEAYEKRVDADHKQGTTVTVRGTPTVYINGKKIQNRSVAGMSATVDQILKEIEAGS